MYDNVSQKLKSFTKVLTIILLVLIPAGGITGGIFLLLLLRTIFEASQ